MADLRPPDIPPALEIDVVTCTECGARVGEDEAQAQRWGYWLDGLGDLYPFCAACAEREFGHRSRA